MRPTYHALVLNLHQPAGNLQELWEKNPWEAKEILFALDRIPRSLWGYEDIARVHLALSGTLLETLADPAFQAMVYGTVDVGSLLWYYQNTALFEILGTAYYHPVLPLIPPEDWSEQLSRWLGIGRHLFWRENFQGFWPPEMGFCMELIPLLKALGYRYVLVDSEHVEPVTPMDWPKLLYRPHVACYGGAEIVVIVRDRDLSNAQESGMEPEWFCREVEERTRWCDAPPLVTTCTDGDNGGWFRNVTYGANFWTAFYVPLLERARGDCAVPRPVFIHEYLDRYGVHGEVQVHTGAWNTGWHHGRGFIQWTGSQRQKDGLRAIWKLSQRVHALRRRANELGRREMEFQNLLEQALWRLLRAETSCNFFWGEAWVERAERDLEAARTSLEAAERYLQS
ncbi:hypothetical protein JCM13664_11170 [Methylothermus subterraneus]